MSSPRPRGFTLVELLVVIAIIGVLVALLLPAVQAAREASRRTTCNSNIRQFGLAAHNFADVKGKLPEGIQVAQVPRNGDQNILSLYRTPGIGPGWAVLLLPFCEQQSLFDTHSGGINNYLQSNGVDQTWRNVRANRINIFRCPADAFHNNQNIFSLNDGNWARGNYGANGGPGWLNWTVSGQSHDGGARDGSSPGFRQFWGGPFGVNYGSRMSELTQQDGASNTILINELRVGLNDVDRRGVWAMPVCGSSLTCASSIGDATVPNDANEFSDDIEDCNAVRVKAGIAERTGMSKTKMGCSNDNLPRNWPNWQAQARSLHPSGVQACFADGSTRTIPNNIPQSVWKLLNSREDGQATPDF
jgi:prepilin-type N-terminal cleavage/methylation domain-containing protein